MKNTVSNRFEQNASAAVRKPSYRRKFRACKRSWLRAVLFGVPAGLLCGLLFSGFELNDIFLGMSALMTVSFIISLSAVFGLKATAGYGCSRFCGGLVRFGSAPLRFFSGSYVRVGFAFTLFAFTAIFWLLGYFLFALFFPIETVYYGIRAAAEKRPAKPAARNPQPAAA